MDALLPYILLALGLMANLGLFVSLKREMLKQSRAQRQALDRLAAGVAAHFEKNQEREPAAAPAPAVPSGFNLSRNVQMMRRWREGEDAAQIAAALGMPRAEVELWIRVQSMPPLLEAAADANPWPNG